MICLNQNDDAILPGHYLDEFSVLQSDSITEIMAQNNLTWVVSMNERILSTSDYYNIPFFEVYPGITVDTSADTTVESVTYGSLVARPENFEIKKMKKSNFVGITITKIKINSRKENWGNGKSEISFVGGQWNSQCSHEFLTGSKISHFKKNEIGNFKSCKLPNQVAQISGPVSSYFDDENAWILVYEEDNRNKFNRSKNPNSFDGISECSQAFNFVSKETSYGDVNFHWSWWVNDLLSLNTNPKIIDCNMNGSGNRIIFSVFK